MNNQSLGWADMSLYVCVCGGGGGRESLEIKERMETEETNKKI